MRYGHEFGDHGATKDSMVGALEAATMKLT
jgi:hypothetical protein